MCGQQFVGHQTMISCYVLHVFVFSRFAWFLERHLGINIFQFVSPTCRNKICVAINNDHAHSMFVPWRAAQTPVQTDAHPKRRTNYALARWIRTECWHPRSLLARANRGADMFFTVKATSSFDSTVQILSDWAIMSCYVFHVFLIFKIRLIPWKTLWYKRNQCAFNDDHAHYHAHSILFRERADQTPVQTDAHPKKRSIPRQDEPEPHVDIPVLFWHKLTIVWQWKQNQALTCLRDFNKLPYFVLCFPHHTHSSPHLTCDAICHVKRHVEFAMASAMVAFSPPR